MPHAGGWTVRADDAEAPLCRASSGLTGPEHGLGPGLLAHFAAGLEAAVPLEFGFPVSRP